MANIKLELEFDSNSPNDLGLFTNLLAAFGGTTGVLNVPVGLGKTGAYAQAVDTVADNVAKVNPFKYSEEELKAMANDDLKGLATQMGIDWANEEGKNTNAKLVKLILRNYEGSGTETAKEEITEQVEDTSFETVTETSKAETTKDAPAEAPKSGLTLNDLKLELGVKVDVGDNREKIVGKLTELGATKLTNLDPKHFPEMMDYLKSL